MNEDNQTRLDKLQKLNANILDNLKDLKDLKDLTTQKMCMSLSSVSKELNSLIIKEITGDIEDES